MGSTLLLIKRTTIDPLYLRVTGGGDENKRQMENNVNCKEMRFVIGYLIDVDDVSPATAPEILPDCLYLHWYFPEEERIIQHINGKYFPQL